MTVSLRIVGIFYRQDDIPFTQGMTVADVLAYASAHPIPQAGEFVVEQGNLTIGPDTGKPSITSFYANYTSAVISETSGMSYGPGPFYLKEDTATQPSYTVWQYYVFNEMLQSGGAIYQPNSPRIESFVDAQVPDGGMVVWRLVNVLAGPNAPPARYQNRLGKLKAAVS